MTDHAPLQWLSVQNMEGLLCHWTLAREEYNFKIMCRKGTLNGNADALSHRPHSISAPVAMTSSTKQITDVQQVQQNDQIYYALLHSSSKPTTITMKQSVFQRYIQL